MVNFRLRVALRLCPETELCLRMRAFCVFGADEEPLHPEVAVTSNALTNSLRMQNHLAHRLAPGEHFERVGGLREREGAVDMGRDFSLRRPLHELLQIGAVLLRVEPRPVA